MFAQASWYLANLDNLEVIKLISQVSIAFPTPGTIIDMPHFSLIHFLEMLTATFIFEYEHEVRSIANFHNLILSDVAFVTQLCFLLPKTPWLDNSVS